MIGEPQVSMFGGHQIAWGDVLDLEPAIGLDHREAGGIHLQETPVSPNYLDTVWAGFRHRSEQIAACV
jgi:hypothetical protein